MAFQNDFRTLDTRINAFRTVVSLLDNPIHQTSPHRQRGLLLARTLLCCAVIQLYARAGTRWDSEDNKVLQAALAAADAIDDLDFARLAYVDPVLGVRPSRPMS